jgi:hypothetical protein
LESEHCAIRSWIAICNMTFGKNPRTHDMASRILNGEIEHEAWFIELLAFERDGKSIPSGHFRRGEHIWDAASKAGIVLVRCAIKDGASPAPGGLKEPARWISPTRFATILRIARLDARGDKPCPTAYRPC